MCASMCALVCVHLCVCVCVIRGHTPEFPLCIKPGKLLIPGISLFPFNPIETIVAFMRRAIAFLSGPWAHICDENKGFTQTPVTFLS